MPALTDHAVGDLVVLGHDGVARIEDVSEFTNPEGVTSTLLKLTVLSARMTVTIPLERANQRGLRAVADTSEALAALEHLAGDAGMETMVGLTWDKQLKRLNHSQRMLRDKAEEAFVTEIGASLGLDAEDAVAKVQESLDARAAGRTE